MIPPQGRTVGLRRAGAEDLSLTTPMQCAPVSRRSLYAEENHDRSATSGRNMGQVVAFCPAAISMERGRISPVIQSDYDLDQRRRH